MNSKTVAKLKTEDYIILNGKIVDVKLELLNNTCMLKIFIQGDGWQCLYGDLNLFDESFNCKNLIIDLLKTLEINDFYKLINTYVRIAVKDISKPVEYIGNIIFDKWFNFNDYYEINIDSDEIDIDTDENNDEGGMDNIENNEI